VSREIRSVAVIGAGTMGHGIAQVCAAAGREVTLIDATSELAELGLTKIRANLEEGVRRQKLTQEAADATAARIVTAAEMSRCGSCDLVIEAVPERPELKRAVFGQVEQVTAEHTLIGSNTSSLSITELQAALRHPARFIGLHFFNPVHINRLLEVVRGRLTSQETVDAAMAFATVIGKDAVLVNDSPGFATSRLGVLLGLEAMRMVQEGVASAADIDKALELGYRHPMGPLKLTDLVGLDVRLDIARYLHEKLGAEHFRPPEILERMVAEGKLGKKSGQGFYEWK